MENTAPICAQHKSWQNRPRWWVLFGNRPQNFEAVIELNHWFQVNQWFQIVPDIQYIINPKGFGNIPDALVVGAQVGVVF
ncbi:MAG: carbohydrate porin [Chlamydiales bacterium]|nr:carbohydrate porin [Chlamydiales bacterium]